MTVYRAGTMSSFFLDDSYYIIQEKKWWGWKKVASFRDREAWEKAIKKLRKQPDAIFQ